MNIINRVLSFSLICLCLSCEGVDSKKSEVLLTQNVESDYSILINASDYAVDEFNENTDLVYTHIGSFLGVVVIFMA